MRELRPHQIHAMALLRQSLLAGKRRPLLQLPTGAGKTVIAATIVRGALNKGNRVIFCVPAIELINQTVASFEAEGIEAVGVMQGWHELTDHRQPVQVCSVQTLQRRKIPEADVVVIDEAHRMFKFYERWMADPAWAKTPFIGLSATPWTKGLGNHYDDLLIACTTQDLIDHGFLSQFRVFAPSHPDLSGVSLVAGDYHEGQLGEAMDKPGLVADVVDTWKRRGENRSTLCFAVNRAHAKSLQRQFIEAGVNAGYVDGFTEAEERKEIAEKFHSGEYRVVVNVGVLTTGVDWDVRCIILARPTRSEMLYVQIIGRGLRTADGKDDCLILDHSDTTLRLGFVTDIVHDELSMGKDAKERQSKDKTPLPKECPSCAFLKPAKVHQCPACGFKPERRSDIECEAGELSELRGGKKGKLARSDKEILFGQLKHYARFYGKREGWAAHAFRDITGVWPNAVKYAPEVQPTPELLSWIKSRSIAFAKSREARHAAAA